MFKKPKVAFLMIATNKYIKFANATIESADTYFLPNCDVTYCIFTNHKSPSIKTKKQYSLLNIIHEPWPAPTLKRYDYFTDYADYLKMFDFMFYCDADMKFVDVVGDEILSEVTGTIHPGFWHRPNHIFSYDRNPNCKAYIPYGEGNYYYAGGFNGGSKTGFLKMAETISNWRKEDEKNNIIPVWHDESYLNKYLYINPPTNQLSPSYCYPESWELPFSKKLLALDKDNHEMRLETV